LDDLIATAEQKLCEAQKGLADAWDLLRQVDPGLYRRAKLIEADVARLRLALADRLGVAA
jgi:hypothetical protein